MGDAKPLAGTKVSLVVTYLFTGSLNGKDMNGEPGISSHAGFAPKDNDKVLATTVTGSDGSFTFNFVNAEKTLGLIDPDFKFKHTGEFGDNANGKIFKVLRLRVEDKYYCSPDVNIKIDPLERNWPGDHDFICEKLYAEIKCGFYSWYFLGYGTGTAQPVARYNSYDCTKEQSAICSCQ